MKLQLKSRVIDVLCGVLAYIGARLVWHTQDVFANLPWELLTFGAIYLLLQTIIRGWKLARAGRAP